MTTSRGWLRDLRLRAGFARQQDLADKLGVSSELVTMWETGARRPGHGHLISLDEILGPEVIHGFRAEAHAEPSQQAS